MIVYIAEKPSVARAVAEVLAKPQQKGDGFITLANGDVITWCIGHLLEQAEPEAYDPAYKKWQKEHLPIIPSQWKQQVKPKTRKQFNTVKKLIKQASTLVNMGDPDRVGQILVDEMIHYCDVSKAKRDAAQRCLINDMNASAIKKSLQQLQPNNNFISLATSALARARADWLYGINMTRLCTIQGQFSGYQGVLSIGRVQTPLLGLVVRRDQEIENFVSKPFFEVFARLESADKSSFVAKWQPSKACEPYQDEEGRVLSKALAQTVQQKIQQQQGHVVAVKQASKKQAPPLPYSLSSLQIDAAKRFRLNAQKTLDICQQLYERHKLLTYPRSDCRYLPVGHKQDRNSVCQAIANNCDALASAVQNADLSLSSKAWNDAKVSAHHAIIPTARRLDSARLSKDELNIYQLVARQYLMQFYPAFEYQEYQLDCEISGGLFVAKQKQTLKEGWKSLLPKTKSPANNPSQNPSFDGDSVEQPPLPQLKKGDPVLCLDSEVKERKTTPPSHFSDATLLAAMTGIARFVNDPNIKKVLRDTDGLGTEATRAGIIELLFKRQFLRRSGRDIHATEVGQQLINSLPLRMTLPDMTAHWESQLEAISGREISYQHFISPLCQDLNQLVGEVSGLNFSKLKGLGEKRKPRKTRKKRA